MEFKNKRHDHELRKSINALKKAVLNHSDVNALYQEALKIICKLHDAPMGFSVALRGSTHENDWIITSLYSLDANPFDLTVPIEPFLNSDNIELNQALGDVFETSIAQDLPDLPIKMLGNTSGFSRVYNNKAAESLPMKEVKSLNHALHTLLGWEKLEQVIVMPVLDATEVYQLLCLVNGKEPYDPGMVRRYWPFLITLASFHCLQTSSEKSQSPNGLILGNELKTGKTHLSLSNGNNSHHLIEEHIPLALVELNKNLRVSRFNPEAETLFDIGKEAVLGRELSDLIPEQFPNQHRIHTFSLLHGSLETDTIRRFMGLTGAGQSVPIQVKSITYRRDDQLYRLLMIIDCTELDVVKRGQQAEVQRFRALAKLAPVGILQTNAQWEAVYINDRWCEITQREADEIEAMGWISSFYYEDLIDTIEALRQAMVEGKEYKGQCRLQSPIGDIVWIELYARPLWGAKGEMSGFLATMIDCTYRHETEQELRRLAERDMLTGLPNRVLFQDRLNHALSRVKRTGSLALLSLDLDGFKDVNDNLGHDAGDLLLAQVAKRLTSCLRDSDTVARVGGDEFLILLEDVKHPEIASKQSENILGALAQPFYIRNQEVFITGSLGVTFASGGHGHIDAQAVLKQVDLALYRAKELGRNNYQYFSPEFELATKDKLLMANSLHKALDRSEFCIFYQLQADLTTNRIVGSEALLRWNHPERGILAPIEFIGLLEETGIIVKVSHWIVTQAFAQHRKWLDEGLVAPGGHIAINLTPRLLRDPSFLTHLIDSMQRYQLKGPEVMVEITESALLERSPANINVLATFERLGLQIALDDFGTGYSSLSYLKRFPIKTIKIDQSFVRDILTDPEDAAITQGIIRLAHSLNLSVVAEGVDDPKKIKPLQQWGCHYFQGYCLNKPTSAKETTQLLKERCQLA